MSTVFALCSASAGPPSAGRSSAGPPPPDPPLDPSPLDSHLPKLGVFPSSPKISLLFPSLGIFSLSFEGCWAFLKRGSGKHVLQDSQAHLVKPWRLHQTGPLGFTQDGLENSQSGCLRLPRFRNAKKKATTNPRKDHQRLENIDFWAGQGKHEMLPRPRHPSGPPILPGPPPFCAKPRLGRLDWVFGPDNFGAPTLKFLKHRQCFSKN